MTLQRLWYGRSAWVWPLVPASWVYCGLVALRRRAYRSGWLPIFEAGVPVIIVGNVTVGGTGKTPVVIALATWLREQGWRPGIVSRGYGGRAIHSPHRVLATSDPRRIGDEPVLLARHAACPVAVCRRRIDAVSLLLQETDCNVILADDGLQHYALHRDIEICVINGARRLGNGRCLPAGPLREPASRLDEVDAVLSMGAAGPGEWPVQRIVGDLRGVRDNSLYAPLHALRGQRIHAVAGIGDPAQFFASLRERGVQIMEHPFPDHHTYAPSDLAFNDGLPIVMTEKDAVKCQSWCGANAYYLENRAQLDPIWLQQLAVRVAVLRERTWSRVPRQRQ